MPRKPRIIVPGAPHHITQRGGRRADVFFREEDRRLYLSFLEKYSRQYDVLVVAYCLMTNHVHHILIPPDHYSLARTLNLTHMRYSQVINGREGWTGHLWQQRYYSSPLDWDYFWTAVRYVERNPVEAKMVNEAWKYQWSSARYHCNLASDSVLSSTPELHELKNRITDWKVWLCSQESPEKLQKLRLSTSRDLPCGSDHYIEELEREYNRNLTPRRFKRNKP